MTELFRINYILRMKNWNVEPTEELARSWHTANESNVLQKQIKQFMKYDHENMKTNQQFYPAVIDFLRFLTKANIDFILLNFFYDC